MRTLFVILLGLCLAACSWAQPWGPYEITATGDSLQNLRTPQIAIIDSQTARVFYTLDGPNQSEVRTALYDLASHQVIGTPELARSDTVSHQLLDAAVDGPDAWVLIFNRRLDSNWVATRYLIGHAASRSEGTMGVNGCPSVEWLPCRSVRDFDLVSRVGGGWVLTWVDLISGPPYYEEGGEIYVAGLSTDSMEYCRGILPSENQLFGPYFASAVSVAPDTSLVLTEALWGPYWDFWSMLLRGVAGANSESLDVVCAYDCNIDPLSFRRLSDGSFIAYADPNTLYRVSGIGECEVLGSLSPGYRPTDLDFQADYGFASIWVNSNWIQLGRMHMDGTIAELGVFYWWDGEHAVRDASVAVSPDGRIYVAWTERSSSETRLMIARINWDTPLSTGDRDFIPHPSSFILSAYPNPFNPSTTVRFSVPKVSRVTLTVYDILGRRVTTLGEGLYSPGPHELVWNCPACPSGVYVIQMNSEGIVQQRKMLLMK